MPWSRKAKQRARRLLAVDLTALPPQWPGWDFIRTGLDVSTLPTRHVDIDAKGGAVLSWRWDRDLYEGRSGNVALAVQYARHTGLRSLFLDLVTVDQKKKGEELLEQVASLAALYEKIPVIVVGDHSAAQAEWHKTFYRPWLLYEARTYARNPTSVTYVGVGDAGSFATTLRLIREAGFAIFILFVLTGWVGMQSTSDFRFIIRPYAEAFRFLFHSLDRDDYLFSVFLMCALHEQGQQVARDNQEENYGLRLARIYEESPLSALRLNRFRIGEAQVTRPYETCRAILLDGAPIAEWRNRMTTSFDRDWIRVLPHAEKALFRAVGMPRKISMRHEKNLDERMRWLFLPPTAPSPTIRQFRANVQQPSWLEEA